MKADPELTVLEMSCTLATCDFEVDPESLMSTKVFCRLGTDTDDLILNREQDDGIPRYLSPRATEIARDCPLVILLESCGR